MRSWHKLMLVLAALAAVMLVGGVAFAASSGSTKSKAPAVKKAQVSHAKRSQAPSKPNAGSGENTAGDRDNVQSGDQSAPDTPGQGEEQSSEAESSSDTEQGQAGEPAQGHEDPPGDVNHECTGNCQE